MKVLERFRQFINRPWVIVATIGYNLLGFFASLVLALKATTGGDLLVMSCCWANAVFNLCFVVVLARNLKKRMNLK